MRLPALLATLTFVALAFAGCSGNDGDGDGTSSSTSTSTGPTMSGSSTATSGSATMTTSGSSSTTSTGPANTPPTGSISASVNGTAVAFNLIGTDADGDTLVWDLVFGDGAATNGTALPASVNHTYAVGNFTANFTLTDGTSPVSYSVNLTVALSGATGQSFSGSLDVGAIGCLAPDQPYAAELDGIDVAVFEIAPATIGRPFTATFTGSALFNGLSFYDGATPAGHVEDFNDIDTPGTIIGVVPAGAVHGMAFSCAGAAGVTYATS
mgnify:CR=1 FL=1